MRKFRNVVTFATPVAGMVLVLAAVLLVRSSRAELALVVLGLLLVEGGVWRLAGSVLPNERQYLALRAESNRFIAMVRQLNSAAVALRREETPGARMAMEEMKRAMHRSVERMVLVAGRPSSEVPADAAIELPEAERAIVGQGSSAVAGGSNPGPAPSSSE